MNGVIGAPSAAARLLMATIAPGADAARWDAADPGTRDAALRLAEAARLDVLLAAQLASVSHPLPEALAARVAKERTLARLAWVEGGRVLDALEAAGCRPIALKGADVGGRAWAVAWSALDDRALLRAAADLDALVAPDALTAASQAMRALGYRDDDPGAAHHARFRSADGPAFSVEIHVDLFDRPHGLALDLGALRARAVVVDAAGAGARRVLAPEDAFVHVAGHAVFSDVLADPISTLRGPLDLLALAAATPIDPSLTARRAAEAGLAGAVHVAVDWTRALLEGRTPARLDAISAALPRRHGWRARLGARRAFHHAAAATSGRSATRLPFTATRALLAPSALASLAMLLEGARRRL